MKNNNSKPMNRICAIHDLSCFGRCALTVIMPTLSAMHNQVIPIPTALLSTHTGGFTDMHFIDFNDSMCKIADHFKSLDISFDSIYSGFLGSEEQIDTVLNFIDNFKNENCLVLVDPVMGDDGELYSTYTQELMLGMRRLCEKADVITPNLTEAFFLTETVFCSTDSMSKKEVLVLIRALKDKLLKFGVKKLVITGIPFANKLFATYGYDASANKEHFYTLERVKLNYPGTGDLFASVLLGKLLKNEDFGDAIAYSSELIRRVMEYSSQFDTPVREGVAFEAFLGELADPYTLKKEKI
jgi:pyridoxine kinase